MSYEARGSVRGVSVSAAGVSTAKAAVGGALVVGAAVGAAVLLLARVAGKATVLAGKGVVFVGRQLWESYQEHERKVAERAERQAATRENLRQLSEELAHPQPTRPTQAKPQSTAQTPTTWDRARLEARRRQAEAREAARLREAIAERDALRARVEALSPPQAEPAPNTPEPPTAAADVLREIETAQARLRGIERETGSYESISAGLDEEERRQLIDEAQKLAAGLTDVPSQPADDAPVSEWRAHVAALSQQARAASGDVLSLEAMAVRLEQGRSIVANHPCLSTDEREEVNGLLSRADEALARLDHVAAEEASKRVEDILSAANDRDVSDWVKAERTAKKAVGQARNSLDALMEDEVLLAMADQQNKRQHLDDLRKTLTDSERQFALGNFSTVAVVSKDLAAQAAKLTATLLEAENAERLGGLAAIVEGVMNDRRYTDVKITETEAGRAWQVVGRVGQAALQVDLDESGKIAFDLSRQGFSSEQACQHEIDGFLADLGSVGIVIDIPQRTSTWQREGEGAHAVRDRNRLKETE